MRSGALGMCLGQTESITGGSQRMRPKREKARCNRDYPEGAGPLVPSADNA